ncbi:thiamine pyrophosphate-dependent enzyme [[Eubacterium] cellulosolvens]
MTAQEPNLQQYRKKLGKLEALTETLTHYCPGCEHGELSRLIANAIEKLGIRERTVMIDSVGCSALAFAYFNVDHVQSPHGRAPAIATGLKRARPELVVYTIQGDGDALAIGLSEVMYAAIRGQSIAIFLVNNAIYGMTGGQMAPTTLQGQITTTTPYGRDVELTGAPVDASRLLSSIDGAAYVKRVSLAVTELQTARGKSYSIKNILEAKEAIENAFKVQMMGGFSFVECLSSCWVNWKLPIMEAKRFVNERLIRQYPLGTYKDKFGIEKK